MLLVYNITGAPVVLAAGSPVRTIPASAAAPARGKPVAVTTELRPNLTVDPANGVAGGLTAANFTALQAQSASLVFEWTGDPEYVTGALVVGGSTPGTHAASHLPGAGDALTTAAPVATGSANAEGAAASFARSNHVHAIGDATLTPAKDAVADAEGLGAISAIRVPLVAAGPGAADDVVVYNANAPFAFRVLDAMLLVVTAVVAATVAARTDVGGGGTALTDALSGAATGVVRNTTLTATATVTQGGTLAVRRSDNGVGGELILTIQKI